METTQRVDVIESVRRYGSAFYINLTNGAFYVRRNEPKGNGSANWQWVASRKPRPVNDEPDAALLEQVEQVIGRPVRQWGKLESGRYYRMTPRFVGEDEDLEFVPELGRWIN